MDPTPQAVLPDDMAHRVPACTTLDSRDGIIGGSTADSLAYLGTFLSIFKCFGIFLSSFRTRRGHFWSWKPESDVIRHMDSDCSLRNTHTSFQLIGKLFNHFFLHIRFQCKLLWIEPRTTRMVDDWSVFALMISSRLLWHIYIYMHIHSIHTHPPTAHKLKKTIEYQLLTKVYSRE